LELNKDNALIDDATTEAMTPDPVDTLDHDKPPVAADPPVEGLREEDDPSEALPPGEADDKAPMTPEEMERLYDQFEMEDDVNYKFDRILDYVFQDGVIVLKARYYDDDIGEHDLAVPFPILKRDVPLELACFIRDKVIEDRRGGHYNMWAKSTLKAHARGVRRLYNIDATYRVYRTRRAKANRMSKNARNARATINKKKVKMGIEIPRNTKEALFFDRQNKTTLWADAIFKEMCGLRRLNVCKFHAPNHKCDQKDGWQFAPMHMIFDVKQQDMRYKAWLVVGGT
jgi:hypothetical protein